MTSMNTHLVNAVLRFVVKRKLGSRALTVAEVTRTRAELERHAARARPPRGVLFSKVVLGGVPGESCRAPGTELPGRTLLYLHGGAYALGSSKVYRRLAWRLADVCCARVITIDYRLAPEHPYPAAPDDALAAYAALIESGQRPGNIALAGDSAGGNLVLALLQRIRAAGLPMPASAVCLSPWADLTGAGESLRTNAVRDPMLPAHRFEEAATLYAPDQDLRDPLLSPVFADFKGFPPLALHVGSTEILLDDAIRVARAAERDDVATSLRIWPAQPHVFPMLSQWLPEGREAITAIGRFVVGHWLRRADLALADLLDPDALENARAAAVRNAGTGLRDAAPAPGVEFATKTFAGRLPETSADTDTNDPDATRRNPPQEQRRQGDQRGIADARRDDPRRAA